MPWKWNHKICGFNYHKIEICASVSRWVMVRSFVYRTQEAITKRKTNVSFWLRCQINGAISEYYNVWMHNNNFVIVVLQTNERASETERPENQLLIGIVWNESTIIYERLEIHFIVRFRFEFTANEFSSTTKE